MQEKIRDIARALQGKRSLDQGRQMFSKLWGGVNPDAFSMLARSVVQRPDGKVRTGSYAERDADVHGNIGGSHAAVVALEHMHEYFQDATLVTNSAVLKTNEAHAAVAAKELEESGIPARMITIQDESFSTLTEILQNIKLLVEHHRTDGWRNLVILVNGTQLKRASAILEKADTMIDPASFRERPGVREALVEYKRLRDLGEVCVHIVSSEDILELAGRHYARLVRKAKESEVWKRTQEKDDEAAQRVLDGTYGTTRTTPSIVQ